MCEAYYRIHFLMQRKSNLVEKWWNQIRKWDNGNKKLKTLKGHN